MRERKLPYQLKKHLSAWRYNLDNWHCISYEPNKRFVIGHRYTTQTQTFEFIDGKWCRVAGEDIMSINLKESFKERIEKKIGHSIKFSELSEAIKMAKDDVIFNNLYFGKPVTPEEFQDVVVRCLQTLGRCVG